MSEIDINQFAEALADGALLIDCRETEEYVGRHVPGAISVPLGTLPAGASGIAQDQPFYVICSSGNRSGIAVRRLRSAGYQAISVKGGTQAWIRSGRPVVAGPEPGSLS